MNVRRLVDALSHTYDEYIHEIIIVNDNSTDGTAEVARRGHARAQPRVKAHTTRRRRTASGARCATAMRPRPAATS